MIYDKLLYLKIENVPINIIQMCVSEATGIPLETMLMKTRKREICTARQISMRLTKEYTKFSLAFIGAHHGGKDHATVLHACKTIDNMLDTKDPFVIDNYKLSDRKIRDWNNTRSDLPKKPTLRMLLKRRKTLLHNLNLINVQINTSAEVKKKSILVKIWILNKVPLEIRQKLLNDECTKEMLRM